MANGQQFKETEYTAACNIYPLGSQVQVRSLQRGARDSVVQVRITDRVSTKYPNRIDLSPAAFDRLGDRKQGLIQVEVVQIPAPAAAR